MTGSTASNHCAIFCFSASSYALINGMLLSQAQLALHGSHMYRDVMHGTDVVHNRDVVHDRKQTRMSELMLSC